MTKAGQIGLVVIALIVPMMVLAAGIGAARTTFSLKKMYTCDFRLISAATCNLPLAANTIRTPVPAAERNRLQYVARRDRIVACERERTVQRQSGESVPVAKCWREKTR